MGEVEALIDRRTREKRKREEKEEKEAEVLLPLSI